MGSGCQADFGLRINYVTVVTTEPGQVWNFQSARMATIPRLVRDGGPEGNE